MSDAYAALAVLWLLAAMTPGPNFFAVMHVAAARGRRAAMACALGTVVGTGAWALAGFFGLQALFAAWPAAETGIKALGAAYLVWVGLGFWRAAQGSAPAIGAPSTRRAFFFGLATNLTNPKTAAFAVSLFAAALPAGAGTAAMLGAVVMVCAISTTWYGIVCVVGSLPVFVRAYDKARSSILRVTAVVFCGFGASLAFEAVNGA